MTDQGDQLKQEMWGTGLWSWGLGGTGPGLLQECALLVRADQSSLMGALDLISEVGCGNYRQKEKLC